MVARHAHCQIIDVCRSGFIQSIIKTMELFYEIAEHLVVVETKSAEETRKLLPNFEPFLVDGDMSTEPLIYFKGECDIKVPSSAPKYRFDYENIKFNVYDVEGGEIISMTYNGVTHLLFTHDDKQHFESNLSMTDSNEKLFMNFLLRAAYGLSSIHKRTIKMHASVTEKDGKALVFLGVSGTGKSTHSRLWREFVPGSTLLNDDEPIIRLLDDGSVRVYGGPWSGSTPCYKQASADVSAFVHLYQSKENKLTKLSTMKGFSSLYQSVALMQTDKEGRMLAFNIVTDILNVVPCYKLENRPDREAVSLTETLM